MRFTKTLPLVAVLGSFATAVAFAAAHDGPPAMTGKLGEEVYLMNAEKMTLYTFDKDETGVSNCYDQCAVNWPPLAGDPMMSLPYGYSVISRTDGTSQIAYKGQPLYLWINDHKPGDMTGDGVNGVWHTARP